MEQIAYIVLENGRIFRCLRFGALGNVTGEVVFTTGMTGYLETMTDKSYYGQIVVQTFPLIGNYGVIPSDFESSKPQVKAYIVKEWCRHPSNFRCEEDLDTYLKQQGIIGLYDVDTRELTKIIREFGVMNGRITSDLMDYDLKSIQEYKITNAVKQVSSPKITYWGPDQYRYRVGLWDFGAKENIIRELIKRNCQVVSLPHNITAKEINQLSFDGIMLSNGPGDPTENTNIIKELRLLLNSRIPIFGICLGHQLLALAHGAKIRKLKFGHRGSNQPVREEATGRVYTTSQNHGYAVISESLDKTKAKVSFTNVNDGTCEGISYTREPAFSVQFHPEASAGPLDTSFLFEHFIQLMGGEPYAL